MFFPKLEKLSSAKTCRHCHFFFHHKITVHHINTENLLSRFSQCFCWKDGFQELRLWRHQVDKGEMWMVLNRSAWECGTLQPAVANPSPCRAQLFTLPCPTLQPAVANSSPCHAQVFTLLWPTHHPAVANPSPCRAQLFTLLFPTLHPAVANSSPCHGQLFTLPWPTLHPAVANSSPCRAQLFTLLWPTLHPAMANPSPCRAQLFTLLWPTFHPAVVNSSPCRGQLFTLPWPTLHPAVTNSSHCRGQLFTLLWPTLHPAMANFSPCRGQLFTLPWPTHSPPRCYETTAWQKQYFEKRVVPGLSAQSFIWTKLLRENELQIAIVIFLFFSMPLSFCGNRFLSMYLIGWLRTLCVLKTDLQSLAGMENILGCKHETGSSFNCCWDWCSSMYIRSHIFLRLHAENDNGWSSQTTCSGMSTVSCSRESIGPQSMTQESMVVATGDKRSIHTCFLKGLNKLNSWYNTKGRG